MSNGQQPPSVPIPPTDKEVPVPVQPTGQPTQPSPAASFNPGSLPPHIQEQLRRQMQVQNMARQQQAMQPGIRPPAMPMMQAPGGFVGMMPGMPGAVPMGGMVPPGMVAPPPRPLTQTQGSGQAPPPMQSLQQHQQQQKRCPIPATRLAALSQVKPFFPGIDEPTFMHSLSQFLGCVGIPLRKPPVVQGRNISLLQLLNTVTTYGGFARVSDTRRWPAVAASLSLNPANMDSLATLHSIYGTLLYPYEQYMVHKIPPDVIQCINNYVIIDFQYDL